MVKIGSLQFNNFPRKKFIWGMLLFLASMNFMAKYFYFIFAAFVVIIVANRFKCAANLPVVLLLGISGFYIFNQIVNGGSFNAVLKFLAFPMSYIIGLYFVTLKSNDSLEHKENSFQFMLYSITIGNFLHVLLNYITNFDSASRYTIDVWSGIFLSATGQASLFCMLIGVGIALLFSTKSNIAKVLVCIALVVMMLYNFILSCRSVFIMLFIVMLVALIHLFKQKNTKKSRHIIFSLGIILVFVLAFVFNLFNLQDTLIDSAFYERVFGEEGMGFSDTRGSSKIGYLKNLWKYPFGGGHIKKSYGYAHDIFLDTWDMVGIVGFLFVVFFMLYTIYSLFLVLKNRKISFQTRQLALCVYISLFLEFCIEPVFVGTQWLFSSFCIFCGGLDALVFHQSTEHIKLTNRVKQR